MAVRLKFDMSTRFEGLSEIAEDAIDRALAMTALEIWGNIREESPVDHGRLAGSFTLERQSRMSHRIFTNVQYALAVHEGTKPHDIFPIHRKALFWKGAPHPVRRVRHPGTRANPFMLRAMEKAERRIPDFVQLAVNDATRGKNL